MKKKKAVELNELEKNNIVQDLLHKMDAAARKDEEMFHAKQPAVHKLNMLENVKRIVAVKALHNTLLDFDVLAVLRSVFSEIHSLFQIRFLPQLLTSFSTSSFRPPPLVVN